MTNATLSGPAARLLNREYAMEPRGGDPRVD
jgi:hypothetical protein